MGKGNLAAAAPPCMDIQATASALRHAVSGDRLRLARRPSLATAQDCARKLLRRGLVFLPDD